MKETGLTGKRRSTTIAATTDDGKSQRKRRRRRRLCMFSSKCNDLDVDMYEMFCKVKI